MSGYGSSTSTNIGLLSEELSILQNPEIAEVLSGVVDNLVEPNITVKLLSDTLKFTIVQIFLKGEVSDPSLVLDLSSLIGATPQSSMANITGNSLPYLPPLTCTGASLDDVKCNTCSSNKIGSYGQNTSESNICIQDPNLQQLTPNNGSIAQPLANECVNCLSFGLPKDCEPLVLNNWDIIGFSPPENWYRSDPAQLGVPLISGVSNNYSKITYAVAEADSLTDILAVFSEINVYGYQGKWVPEGSCQYRFYITGVDIVQLQTTQLLSQLRNYPNIIVNQDIGDLTVDKQGFYQYEIFGQTYYQLTLTKPKSSLSDAIQYLNSVDYNGYVGKWTATSPCQYTFKATVTSLQLGVDFDVLNYQFLTNRWRVNNVTYALKLPGQTERKVNYIMYVKGEYSVKIGIYPTNCHCTGPYTSIQYILSTIVTPQQWYYPQTRVYSEDLWTGQILQVGEGSFTVSTQLKEVVTEIQANPDDWSLGKITDFYQGSIIVEAAGTKIEPALVAQGWTTLYPEQNKPCLVYTNDGNNIQLVCTGGQTNIQGNIDSLELVIDTVIKLNGWEYYPVKIPSEESLQIIQLGGGQEIVRSSKQMLAALQTYAKENGGVELPGITGERMELLVNKYPLNNTLTKLNLDNWEITHQEDGYATVQHTRWQEMYGQLYQSGNNTNIWAPVDTITYIDKLLTQDDAGQMLPGYSYPTGVTVAVWPLHEYGINVSSPYSERYQIVATKQETTPFISEFCRKLSESGRGNCSDYVYEREYSSVTIREEPNLVVDQLLQFQFTDSNLKWMPGLLCCERNGPCILRLVEFIGGEMVASPHFVQLSYVGSSYVDGAVIINGEQIILSKYVYPVIEAFNLSYNVPNSQPKFQNNSQRPPVIGKVVGYTGLIDKGPTCGAKPRAAISALAWNLSTTSRTGNETDNEDGSINNSYQPYAELLWENYGILPDCKVRGETAFLMTGTGNYAVGILGSLYGNQLSDNGGQPPIPNNAEYATGNILLKTNGPVYGTITLRVDKYAGWWNIVNFFDKNTDNLAQSIQANHLMYRDWIRVMKQRFEEDNFVPWLIRQEQMNRTRLRPGPFNQTIIVHTIAGQLTFQIPPTPDNVDKTPVERLKVQQDVQQLLATYLTKPVGTINLGVTTEGPAYTVSYSVPAGTVRPNQAMAWLPRANAIRQKLAKLPDQFEKLRVDYPSISTATDAKITTRLNSFAIDNTSTSKIKLDSNDIIGMMLSEYKLGQILIELENMMRGGLRPNPASTAPALGGTQHQVGGVNVANQSRWLETQVNRTLYGSEFPIPLLPPDGGNPYYRFTTGEPVFGFYQNAWATGVTVPLDAPPPLMLPPPNSLGNQAFSTMVARQRRQESTGGNTKTYSR